MASFSDTRKKYYHPHFYSLRAIIGEQARLPGRQSPGPAVDHADQRVLGGHGNGAVAYGDGASILGILGLNHGLHLADHGRKTSHPAKNRRSMSTLH